MSIISGLGGSESFLAFYRSVYNGVQSSWPLFYTSLTSPLLSIFDFLLVHFSWNTFVCFPYMITYSLKLGLCMTILPNIISSRENKSQKVLIMETSSTIHLHLVDMCHSIYFLCVSLHTWHKDQTQMLVTTIPQHLLQGQAHSRYSVNVCWMNTEPGKKSLSQEYPDSADSKFNYWEIRQRKAGCRHCTFLQTLPRLLRSSYWGSTQEGQSRDKASQVLWL
jgi:hypothetical protein